MDTQERTKINIFSIFIILDSAGNLHRSQNFEFLQNMRQEIMDETALQMQNSFFFFSKHLKGYSRMHFINEIFPSEYNIYRFKLVFQRFKSAIMKKMKLLPIKAVLCVILLLFVQCIMIALIISIATVFISIFAYVCKIISFFRKIRTMSIINNFQISI